MDEPTRRAWSKPELIVLVRGKPEEAVLGACKLATGGSGLRSMTDGCDRSGSRPCDPCRGSVGS